MSRLAKILYICAALSVACFFISRVLITFWVPFLWIPLGLSVVFLVSALIVDRALVGEFLSMKSTKHGMNMGLMILLVVVGLAVINFIGVRRSVSYDFTDNKVNSLSEQSIKALGEIEEDLRVRFFYQEGVEGAEQLKAQFRQLIQKYQDKNSKVKLEFIDINRRPDLAEEYEVRDGGGVVFIDYQGRRSRIEKIDEQEITSSLLKVSREGTKKVYVLSGHGELSIEGEQAGLSTFSKMLRGSRYEVEQLSLLDTGRVPEDADVLALIGPRQNFLENEVNILRRYLESGGKMFVAIEPKIQTGLEGLWKDLGLELGNNYVVTVTQTVYGNAVDPNATAASQFSKTHQITKPFGSNQFVVFRLPQSLSFRSKEGEKIKAEPLAISHATSLAFATSEFDGDSQTGPFNLAYSVSGVLGESDKEFGLVIVGDSDFVSNQLLYQNLNRDLALNSISYLAEEESLISITPKEVERTQLNLSENVLLTTIFAVFIPMPLILLVTSLVLWFRRRHA